MRGRRPRAPNILDWLRRIVGRNPFFRRRLVERVLRRLGVSKSRAVGLVRRIP